jgi:DNA polymerase-3 subunit beta
MQENLAHGLSIVGRAVAARSTLPILSNILIATDKSRLKFSATNLEISVNCWVGAKVEQEGAITVPARLLADFINSLPPDPVEFSLISRTGTVNLKCGRYEANIRGIDAQEFPLIIVPDEDEALSLEAPALCQMIDRVVFAAATDESRPVLTGVHADLRPTQLTLAAADSYRLSVASSPLAKGPEHQTSLIIPARALQELRRIVGEEERVSMQVSSNRNQVFFHLTDVDLISQLVEGTFPDYRQIIPTAYATRTTANTADFLKAVRIASIFARDAANIARLQIAPDPSSGTGRLIITATSSEFGDNVSELDVTIEGQPIDIAFNAHYLADALGVIGSAEVVLETRDPNSPGVIKPVGGADFVHIIMPMHVAR